MAENCIYVDEGETYDVAEQKLRRARKSWVCDECRETIQPGDLYEHFKGLFEGIWDEYRTCARCCNVRRDFFRGHMFTGMVEDFEVAHGFDYRDGIPEDFTPCSEAA